MHTTAHLFTAAAYYIIGLTLLGLAFSVWLTHPINRVFIFGRYLTEYGLRVLLMSWPMVSLFGAFIFSCAVDHHISWYYTHGNSELKDAVKFFGIVEAVISWVTALILIYMGGRTLKRVLWRR